MSQTIFDRFPRPACADLLGWRLLDYDAQRGWAKLGFDGRPEFLNPAGFIQGGLELLVFVEHLDGLVSAGDDGGGGGGPAQEPVGSLVPKCLPP